MSVHAELLMACRFLARDCNFLCNLNLTFTLLNEENHAENKHTPYHEANETQRRNLRFFVIFLSKREIKTVVKTLAPAVQKSNFTSQSWHFDENT